MKRATPRKRGRPKKQLCIADFRGAGPKAPVQVYLFVKAQMATGKRKEEAIANAMIHFDVQDRSTIQRKIAPFIAGESARHELARAIAIEHADAAKCSAQLVADISAQDRAIARFFERFDRIFSEEERRQFEGVTVPIALKLMDEREELERLRRSGYHKSKRKSAANKSK